MARYVCDTSVILKWFNKYNEPFVEHAQALLDDLTNGKVELATCDLAVFELANALCKGKGLPKDVVKGVLARLFDLPIELYPPDRSLAELTVELVAEYDLTSYDASFIALARAVRCQLISDDSRHHGRVKDGTVLKLEDYPVDRTPQT